MTTYNLDDSEFEALRGKTVIITGGASGIGRAAVKIAHKHGANVAIGDWNEAEGDSFTVELKERVLFQKCDVSNWNDVLALFDATVARFGPIHAVLSNAGVNTETFAKDIDAVDPLTGALLPPDLSTMDVNLTGQIYLAKCALHYFSKWPEQRCALVMTGSAASFIDCPPLHLYCASKTGVLGLMRGLRSQVEKRNVTVNMVAPWMTVTPMLLKQFRDAWEGLPANSPEGPARALLLPVVRPEVNGKSFYIAGNEIVEVEDKLHEAQPVWLGERLGKDVDEGQRRLVPLAPPL